MNATLARKHTIFKNPTPENRTAALAAIKMSLFDRWGYEPILPQLDLHLSTARIRFACAGTRGGKSKWAGEEIAAYLFTGAVRVWIVGQNYSLTSREFKYVYERMNSPEVYDMFGYHPCDPTYGGKMVFNPDQGKMHLRTVWGAEVECVSLERAGGAFGEEVDLICLSEAAQIRRPKELYERILFGRLASRHGDVIIPTTPGGKSSTRDPEGWLHDMYFKGFDANETDYYTREWPSWANPTFTENPRELRAWMNPLIFAEQYEGKFITMTGTVFDKFNPSVHVIAPFKVPKHWRRYEGIDPGFRARFVWLSSVMSENGILYINDEYDDSEMLYEQRVDAIMQHRAFQYNIAIEKRDPNNSNKKPYKNWELFKEKNKTHTITYTDSEDPQCIHELAALGLPNIGANKKDMLVSIDRVQKRLYFDKFRRPTLYVTSNCVKTIDALLYHGWGDKGLKGRIPANDQYKHWGDVVRYILGGILIPSTPYEPEIEVDPHSYWALLQDMQSEQNQHPHDMSREARRSA